MQGIGKVAFAVASLCLTYAQADPLDDAIARIVVKYKLQGIAVAIIREGLHKEPLVRVSGTKNCAGDKVDANTAFMLASTSKTYAGLAAAIAIERGFISGLDEDVQDILGYPVRNPAFPGDPITLRHLLTHRSSMVSGAPMSVQGKQKDPTYGPSAFGLNPTCPLEQLNPWYKDLLVNRPAQSGVGGRSGGRPIVPNWFALAEKDTGGTWKAKCQPGKCFEYSNLGAGLVGAVVEQAYRNGGGGARATFQDFCKKFIFDPMRMTNTAWFSRDLSDSANEATHFDYKPNTRKHTCKQNYCFVDYPSGSLRSSAEDMAKYLQMMVQRGTFSGGNIVSETTFDALTSCQDRDHNGRQPAKCQSGYLWGFPTRERFAFLSPQFGQFDDLITSAVYHDGAEHGAMSEMLVLPEQGVAVGFVSNTNQDYGKTVMDSFDILKELFAILPDSDSPVTLPGLPGASPGGSSGPTTGSTASCFQGQGPRGKPLAFSRANSKDACMDFCLDHLQCVGFDFSLRKRPRSCRLFKKMLVKRPRPGRNPMGRTFCALEPEAEASSSRHQSRVPDRKKQNKSPKN